MPKRKHAKKRLIVKTMLAHQGMDLVVYNTEWYMVCECGHRARLRDRDEAAQSEWHAGHIVDVMKEKGMIR